MLREQLASAGVCGLQDDGGGDGGGSMRVGRWLWRSGARCALSMEGGCVEQQPPGLHACIRRDVRQPWRADGCVWA
jgi:hypothetical protein